MTDSLESLQELLDQGFIQDVEFQKRKAALSQTPQYSYERRSEPKQAKVRKVKENDPSPTSHPTQPQPSLSINPPKPISSTPPAVTNVVTTNRIFPQPSSRDFHQTDFATALVICPPAEFWKPIVDLKKNHMNPRIKRPPYPHITILAPFVKVHRFEDAKRILHEKLQTIQPFTMEINEIELYNNNSSFTLYLKPEVPGNIVRDIFDICVSEFPQCTKNEFDPHIGIGYFRKVKEAEALKRKYQSKWKPMKFTIQEVYMMHRRGKESPFEVRDVIPLGGNTSITPKNTPVPL